MNSKILIFAAAASVLAACSHRSNPGVSGVASSASQPQVQPPMTVPPHAVQLPGQETGGEAIVLKASAFKMSGDYANNVAVTLDDSGNLVYFPAVSDIRPGSKPTLIGEGWWLNRQGLGPNSVFTKWTFEEYMALPATPSPAEIKSAIIKGAEVTEFRQLPVPAAQANVMEPVNLLHLLEE